MSSAPYTFWAIVLIFSTNGICGKDDASATGGYTMKLNSKGSAQIRFGELGTQLGETGYVGNSSLKNETKRLNKITYKNKGLVKRKRNDMRENKVKKGSRE